MAEVAGKVPRQETVTRHKETAAPAPESKPKGVTAETRAIKHLDKIPFLKKLRALASGEARKAATEPPAAAKEKHHWKSTQSPKEFDKAVADSKEYWDKVKEGHEKPKTPQEEHHEELKANLDKARNKLVDATRARLYVTDKRAHDRDAAKAEYDKCLLEYNKSDTQMFKDKLKSSISENPDMNVVQENGKTKAEEMLQEHLKDRNVNEQNLLDQTEIELRTQRLEGLNGGKLLLWYKKQLESYNKLNWKTKLLIGGGLVTVGVGGAIATSAAWLPASTTLIWALGVRGIMSGASILAFKAKKDAKAVGIRQQENEQSANKAMKKITGEKGEKKGDNRVINWDKVDEVVQEQSADSSKNFNEAKRKRYNNTVDSVFLTGSIAVVSRNAFEGARHLLTDTVTGQQVVSLAKDMGLKVADSLIKINKAPLEYLASTQPVQKVIELAHNIGPNSARADIPGPKSTVLPPGSAEPGTSTGRPDIQTAKLSTTELGNTQMNTDEYMKHLNARPPAEIKDIQDQSASVFKSMIDPDGLKHAEYLNLKISEIEEWAKNHPNTHQGRFAAHLEKFIQDAQAKDKLGPAWKPAENDNIALTLTKAFAEASDKHINLRYGITADSSVSDIEYKGAPAPAPEPAPGKTATIPDSQPAEVKPLTPQAREQLLALKGKVEEHLARVEDDLHKPAPTPETQAFRSELEKLKIKDQQMLAEMDHRLQQTVVASADKAAVSTPRGPDKGLHPSGETNAASPQPEPKPGPAVQKTATWGEFWDNSKKLIRHDLLGLDKTAGSHKTVSWGEFWNDAKKLFRHDVLNLDQTPADTRAAAPAASPTTAEPSGGKTPSPDTAAGTHPAAEVNTGKHVIHTVVHGDKLENILKSEFDKQFSGVDPKDRATVIANMIKHRPEGSVPSGNPNLINPGEKIDVTNIMGNKQHIEEMIKHAHDVHSGHGGGGHAPSASETPVRGGHGTHHLSEADRLTRQYNTPGTPENTRDFYNHLPETEKSAIDAQANSYANNQLLHPVFNETHMPQDQQFDFLKKEMSGRSLWDIVQQQYEDPDSAEAKFASHLSALKNEKIAELAKYNLDATPLNEENVSQWLRRVATLEAIAHGSHPSPDAAVPVTQSPEPPAVAKPLSGEAHTQQPTLHSPNTDQSQSRPEPAPRTGVPHPDKTKPSDWIDPNDPRYNQHPDQQSNARPISNPHSEQQLAQKQPHTPRALTPAEKAAAYDKYLQERMDSGTASGNESRDWFQRKLRRLLGKTMEDTRSYSDQSPLPDQPLEIPKQPEQQTSRSFLERTFGLNKK